MARWLASGMSKHTFKTNTMYLFVLRFQIPNTKMHEFNLALNRLVKWPVYILYSDEAHTGYKLFEMLREWENEDVMKKDLSSAEYGNLMGAIKVLGKIKESHIYNAIENKDILQEC